MQKQNLKSIVCIDDEHDILEVAKMSLEAVGGFDVSAHDNGQAGVEKAIETNPDLILVDVMMPGLDGPATLELIKKTPELKNTPVIFMTARVQPSEVEEYKNLGAVGVISKPFDPMELPNDILRIWGEQ